MNEFDKLLEEYDDYIFRETITNKFNSLTPADKHIHPINFSFFDQEMEFLNEVEKSLMNLYDEVWFPSL